MIFVASPEMDILSERGCYNTVVYLVKIFAIKVGYLAQRVLICWAEEHRDARCSF